MIKRRGDFESLCKICWLSVSVFFFFVRTFCKDGFQCLGTNQNVAFTSKIVIQLEGSVLFLADEDKKPAQIILEYY